MSYEFIRTIVELQSLAWTVPVVVFSAFVVKESYTPFKKGLSTMFCGIRKTKNGLDKSPATALQIQKHWFITGIFIGFLGNMVDNFYWTIPWTANYLSAPYTRAWQDFGVFPNIFFRQTLTLLSAYCHIKAFIPRNPNNPHQYRFLNITLIASIIIGQLFIFILWTANTGGLKTLFAE